MPFTNLGAYTPNLFDGARSIPALLRETPDGRILYHLHEGTFNGIESTNG